MRKVVVTSGPFSGTEFALESGELLMGRHADCQLHEVFKDNPGVSRRHARIRCESDHFVLEDLGSRNGTRHNGRRIHEATRLRFGDRISVGGVDLLFLDEDEPAPSRAEFDVGASLHDINSICSTIQVSNHAADTIVIRDAPRKFQALIGMLAKMGDSLDADAVLEGLLEGMFDIFGNVEHGFVAVKDQGESVVPRVVRQRNPQMAQGVRISQTIVNRVMSEKEAVLSQNASMDERFQHNQSVLFQGISSLMCTPLVNRSGDCLGVVQLETTDATPFTSDDLEVLASITPHAAIAIDYARVHADELQRQAIERDLGFARQIQRNFLPSKEPQLDAYRFFSYYEAAYQVGGDYYNYLELPDGRLGVIIADVAGKGISASLIMSKFAGEFKYLLSRENALTDAVSRMNDVLLEDSEKRFITMAALVLDDRTHRAELVNAGHCDTLLRLADGDVIFVDEDVKGTPIGMFPGQQYRSNVIQLSPGDTLVMYTDGLSEATSEDNSLYGVERITQQVGCRRASPD